ncbi:MAG: hypothetical protein H6518_11855 [Microthrixaceae bacterium]|nr:hypothetical protein [Microthrixaceae bacterium]
MAGRHRGARRAMVTAVTSVVFVGLAQLPVGPVVGDANEGPGAPAFAALTNGAYHTCAILGDGTVKCWGSNGLGQLGLGDTADRGDEPGEMGSSLSSVDLGTGRTALAISAGAFHTCALLDDHSVKCWGANAQGRLGLGDTATRGDQPGEMGDQLPAVDLGAGHTASTISAGGAHTCAVLDDGTVKCWGRNRAGQLGLGDTASRGDQPGEMGDQLPAVDLGSGHTATAVGAAGNFDFGITFNPGLSSTCALLDDASVKCWGLNASGGLGLGDTANRGDGPGEMGDALPAVDLGTDRSATALAVGWGHACAVLDDGALKCWGLNGNGQLGLGGNSNRGDGADEMGDLLPAVDLGTGRTAVGVSTGDQHTCAVLDDGSLKCWGRNDNGQLGQGDTIQRGDGPGEMGDQLPAVDLGGWRLTTAVTASGGAASAKADTIVHDGGTTCARLDDDSIKCWGANGYGQLGQGDVVTRGDGAGEMGDELNAVDLGIDPPPRPDLLLRRAGKPWRGDDLSSTDGTGQRVGARRAPRGRATFFVRAGNDGEAPDALRVRSATTTPPWWLRVRYFVGRSDVEVTDEVVAGTFLTGVLGPGATATVRVELKVRAGARPGRSVVVVLEVDSAAEPGPVDVGSIRVQVA